MPLTREIDLMEILAAIGVPLVVTCNLVVSQLNGPRDHQLGACLVSAYHVSVNPEAQWAGTTVWQACSVPPDRILAIEEVHDGSP